MDLASFRHTVDSCPAGITTCQGDLRALYEYVGLPLEASITGKAVSAELTKKIRSAFLSGHQSVWRRCRQLRDELIQRHVIDGEPLDPYFSVVGSLQSAVGGQGTAEEEIKGDWSEAIRQAHDQVKYHDPTPPPAMRERAYAREFAVANAGKRLQAAGYGVSYGEGKLALAPDADEKLVGEIERRIAAAGGLNVARRIFRAIQPTYDGRQERYHLIRHTSPTGGGQPEIPVGYLFLLSVKHAFSKSRGTDTDRNWQELLRLATDYATVLDVQSYVPNLWLRMDAVALLRYLQETAISDTFFRIPQIRGTDVVRLIRGALDGLDFDRKYGGGWSINDALSVTSALLELSHDRRGPLSVNVRALRQACGNLDREALELVLDEVLSHPPGGANQRFTRPSDAPVKGLPELENAGHDFFLRPLLRQSGKSVFLLDRSACAPACLEALLTPLRRAHSNFDDRQVGPAIERFLRSEFESHDIPTLTGCYCVDGQDGECDLVVDTAQTIIFFEIKKKPLTRRAQAGSDAHVLLDLANSLLKAQVQAGWHEVLLQREGFLDLAHEGVTRRLELNGRGIERIAVSLLDFGSFQDRVFSKQFLEGTMNAAFSVSEPSLKKGFDELNESLEAVRGQIRALYPNQATIREPFFHCWFLSVPQLLILLDGVKGEEQFKKELWRTRSVVTGSSNFYWDYARMCQISANAATSRAAAPEGTA